MASYPTSVYLPVRTVTMCVPVHAHGRVILSEKPGTVLSFARPDCREIGCSIVLAIQISIELNPTMI